MRLLSLFSGIGAYEKALERIGIDYDLVGFSEIDKYAIKAYCSIHNVSGDKNLGDITEIDISTLPKDVDIITHSSPCQDFSVAGKQAGADTNSGTRSSLMWTSVEIIREVRPKYIIWENVKNVLSVKHKHNFDMYLNKLEEMGYINYYKVLNAKDYGVPQNRERIFCVSIRKDISKGTFIFPEGIKLELKLKDLLEENVDEKYYLNKIYKRLEEHHNEEIDRCIQVGELDMKGIDQLKRVYSPEGLCPTITTMGRWKY